LVVLLLPPNKFWSRDIPFLSLLGLEEVSLGDTNFRKDDGVNKDALFGRVLRDTGGTVGGIGFA
jgi:hypothetical protein